MTMTDVTTDPTVNTVTWWEIPVQDLAKARAFYTAVFGWGYTSFGEGYDAILVGEQMIGALSESADGAGEGIRIYVQVADMEDVFARVEANGGSIASPRTEIGGDMGWWGSFTDDQGRVIGVATNNPAA